jgi:hypothetical protein
MLHLPDDPYMNWLGHIVGQPYQLHVSLSQVFVGGNLISQVFNDYMHGDL